MSDALCKLSLVFPSDLEDQIVDELLSHPEWVQGFNLWRVDGRGRGLVYRTVSEKVRGRADRLRTESVIDRGAAAALVEHLGALFPNPEIFWWIEPIDAFGRFA